MIKKINIQTAIKRCLLTFAIMASTVVALAQDEPPTPTYVAQISNAAFYTQEEIDAAKGVKDKTTSDEKEEGVNYTQEEIDAAKIIATKTTSDIKKGTEAVTFTTLVEAFTAATKATDDFESKNIELIGNVTLEGDITIPTGWTLLNTKSIEDGGISINLNAHKIHGTFENRGKLTINDESDAAEGTIDALTNNGTLTLSKGFITTLTAGNGSSVTTGEDGTITTLYVAVAEGATTTISGTGYSQISGSGTVTLSNNLTNISILTGSAITLDLNGHTITGTETNAGITNAGKLSFADSSNGETLTIPTITNNNGGTLTIDNCNVTTLANNEGNVTIASGSIVTTLNNGGGSITANGTVTSFSNSRETTIKGAGISKITGAGTIKLGEDRSQDQALSISSESAITLDLNGKNAANVTASGKVVVKDSSAGENAIANLTASASSEITVESGNVTELVASATGAKVNITGGKVTKLTTGDNTEVKFTNITTADKLNAAIELTDKSVIELGGNIELTEACAIASGKNITIDLKGNSITGTIENAGTFVLDDAGKTSGEPATTTYGTVTTISNTGTLTVNNGKVKTLTATAGTTTVNGGTITTGITVSDNATATINSGSTIETLTASNNNVKVNGGNITTIDGTGTINFPAVNSADLLSLALKAKKATVMLTGNIEGNVADGFTLAAGANITINVNGQTVTNTGGNTFEIPAGSLLSLTGSGKINAADGKMAVNNAGTFTLSGPEVASATLNGTQTIEGGTLDAATLGENKKLNVNGGTIKVLTTTSGNTVNTTSGTVEHLANAADATTTISGNGFKEFSGSGTIKLASNILSNLTVNGSTTIITLDLDSYTIQAQANTVNVASGAQLTITGTGSITNNSDASTAISNAGTTIINGGTIASATSTATAGGTLNINSGATVTTLKAGAGETIINGGTVTNLNGEGTIKLGADIENECTVTGGNVTLDLNGHTLNTATGDAQKTVTVNESATLKVKGTSGTVGKINNIGTTNVSSNATVTGLESTGTVNFTGGAITTLTVNGGTADIKASGVGTLNANVGTVTIDVDDHKPTTMNIGSGATVKIGDKTYNFGSITTEEELTQALDMTKSGTLKLGANIEGNFTIPAESNITIDLNGHSITGSSNPALTIKGKLQLNGTESTKVNSVAVENTGDFTLEGATVTTLSSNAGATTLTSGTVGTITASTGTLEIKDATVGEATATGTTNITAGTITTTLNTSAGTTTISGGTITTLNGTGTSDITISNGNITKASAGKKMTVSGGSIGELSTTEATTGDGDEYGLKISAGTITTLNVIASSKANVSGGTIGTIDVANATLTVAAGATVTTYTGAGGTNVKLPSYSITDTDAGSYPNKFVATTASYTRTSGIDNSNRWGTVCLPFEITKEVTGVKFYKVTTLETDKLNLEEYTITADASIDAGTPVVFHIEGSNEVSNLTINSNNAKVDKNASNKEQAGTDVKLVGTFEQKIIDNQTDLTNIYYISDNAFHQAKAKLTVPIYRAYLMVTTSSNGAKPRMIYFNEEDDATGIQSMLADGAEIAGYYDLNGVCHETPQKGMNIVKMKNGKSIKLMIK